MPKRRIKNKKLSFSLSAIEDKFLFLKQEILTTIFNPRNIKIIFIVSLIVGIFCSFWFGRNILADHYFKQALNYETDGNDKKAVELSQKAIKFSPHNSNYWRLIGEIKSKNALNKLKQTKLNTNTQEEVYEILRDDVSGALVYFDKALEIDPGNWQNQLAAGIFYESLIGYAPDVERQAAFSYVHAAELNQEDISTQVAALRTLIFYFDRLDSQGQDNEKSQVLLLAQNILNKLKNSHFSDGVYHFYSGLVLLRGQQFDEAIKELALATAAYPENAYLSYQTGLAYFAKGDIENAKNLFLQKKVQQSVYGPTANKLLTLYDSKHSN